MVHGLGLAGQEDGELHLLLVHPAEIGVDPVDLVAVLHNGAQGVLHQLHGHVVVAAVQDEDLLLELRQVFHLALGIVLDRGGGLGGVFAPRRGDAHHVLALGVGVQEGVGHGGEVVAPLAAPVEEGLVQDALLQLWVLLGVDARVQPVLLGLPALGAHNILGDLS